ncbi:fumarylacetoacetate hydrolase family protein [Sphingopyxis granuli]|uniref:fumarylacetoacetate hydrolase family protein n=1 Tax=Sphingopyxis granuli TaxID=267128 RepID=UPI001BAECFB9|nr:fumarylacetoacetate hydrolase family protein [Sphingopyxis granuli]QUM71002.1 fumarylacetoacetate hydrolase family protein [Sphingopyxis granuli]
MRLVSFSYGGCRGYGVLASGQINRLDGVHSYPADLRSALAAGIEALDLSRATQTLDPAQVTMLAPVPDAGKVLCVATNFHEAGKDKPIPQYPLVFTRFADTFVGHGEPLSLSPLAEKYDYEGELAVVIGKPAYKVEAAQAMDHIAGYTCLNDGSVRDWQKHSTQFTPGKNFYRSGSMGPWLVRRDELPDLAACQLKTRVNGELRQSISLGAMIFDIPWLIAYFSSFTPLAPGDVIATGTPSGFGSSRDPQIFLKQGDVVEVDITGIGILKNTVQAEPAHPTVARP